MDPQLIVYIAQLSECEDVLRRLEKKIEEDRDEIGQAMECEAADEYRKQCAKLLEHTAEIKRQLKALSQEASSYNV